MRVDRARRGVVFVIAAVLALAWATPAGADDDPPQIMERVPVRIHGTDTDWPPVLVFLAVVVVGGAIVVAVIFLRRAREATRADRSIR
jgi:hypothetical protein